MGNNTLTTRTDGETIPASDHNEILEALRIDLVPRNNSNAAEDVIGSLGTSALRWLRAYCQEYRIGTAANNLRIYEGAAGQIWIENPNNDRVKISDGEIELITNNVTRFKVNDTGIVWADQADNSIPRAKVSGYVFPDPEVIDVGEVDDDGGTKTVKTNLPNNALVFAEFYGDGDGSNIYLFSDDNFASSDTPLIIANHREGLGTGNGPASVDTNFARAGSNLKYIADGGSTGRTSMRVHIYYIN